MKIAVITGASSGMGREFARQLTAAERFDEIWIIARRENRLLDLKKKKTVSVPGTVNKLQTFAVKHLPEKWVMKIWLKQQKH